MILGLVAVAAMAPALARVDFKPIEGAGFAYVADMTSDGSKVLVYDFQTHYTYTAAEGLVAIGGVNCAGNPAISSDGTVIVSSVYAEDGTCQAAKWLGGQDWLPMGSEPGAVPCGDSLSSAWATNNTTAVGLFWRAQVCMAIGGTWDLATGTAGPVLESSVPNRPTRGNGITQDGTIVVGWQDAVNGQREAVKWVNGVQEFIVDADGQRTGEADGVNSDGSVIWGGGYRNDGTGRGWLWRAGHGFMPMGQGGIGILVQTVPIAASEDGSVVIGLTRNFDAGVQYGWIWTAKKGWSPLNDYLKGQVAAGWDLNAPTAISADGRIIAGTGLNPSGRVQAYIIDLKAGGKP
jgi:hypothetical protein